MSERTRSCSVVLSCAVALISPAYARAAQVKGVVDAPPAPASTGRTLGYTRTRVAAPAVASAQRKADVAVLLSVKTSLPIPAAAEPYHVALSGLRFVPSVAACVVDGKVAFTNDDRAPITLLVENQPVATIAPGETKTYDCTAPEPKMRRLRVKEWPHSRATLFVGEIGVVAQPGAGGAFSLSAPQGKYELQVLGPDGTIARRDVEVTTRDVDVGRIAPQGGAQQVEPAKAADGGAKPAEGGAAEGAGNEKPNAGQP